MKRLQVSVRAEEWDESIIFAVGATRNGRQMVPRGLVARLLPEPWITVWHGLVEKLRGVAPGEWAATFISAEQITLPLPEDAEPEAVPQVGVALVVHRRWDDGTTAEPVEMVLPGDAAVGFFDFVFNC